MILTELFEEVIERLARTARGLGLRLRARVALDGDARREQLARVPRVFRRDPHRDNLDAFEPLACVERFTLHA